MTGESDIHTELSAESAQRGVKTIHLGRPGPSDDDDDDDGGDDDDSDDDDDDDDADQSPVRLTCNDIPSLSGDASEAESKLTSDSDFQAKLFTSSSSLLLVGQIGQSQIVAFRQNY